MMMRWVLAYCAAMLLLVACGGDGETADEPHPDWTASQIIERASAGLDGLSSFHFKLEQKHGGTPIAMGLEMTGVEGDIIPPDRLSMQIEAKLGPMPVDSALITVGESTRMQNPLNNRWEDLSDDFKAVTLFQPGTGIKAVMESATDLTRLESQTVGGDVCFHLQGEIRSEVLDAIAVGHAAEGLSVDIELWIGAEDLLLRRVIFDGRITDDEVEGIIRTLTLSDFNAPITIELPD